MTTHGPVHHRRWRLIPLGVRTGARPTPAIRHGDVRQAVRPAQLLKAHLRLLLAAALGISISGLTASAAGGQPAVNETARPPEVITRNSDLNRLVRQLGAAEFSLRQEAARQLLDAGPAAISALEKGRRYSDPEVQARSAQLLWRVRKAYYAAVLHNWLDHAGQSSPVELPGWERLAAITGDSPAARALYTELLQTEPQLLLWLEEDPEQLRTELQQRTQHATGGVFVRYHMAVAEVSRAELTILLLASVSDRLGPGLVFPEELLRSPPLPPGSELTTAPEHEPLRKLLGAWVLSPEAAPRDRRFKVAQLFDLAEGVQPAREMAGDPTSTPRERQDAIVMLARYGGLESIPDLESLLADEAELRSRTHRTEVRFSTRVQDVALAALLYLTSQDQTEYGFAAGTDRNAPFSADSNSIGFANNEARREALRKWRTWRAVKLQSPLFGPLDAIAGTTL